MIIALAVGAVILLVGLSVRGLLRATLVSQTKYHHGVREDKLAMFKAIRKSNQPTNIQDKGSEEGLEEDSES